MKDHIEISKQSVRYGQIITVAIATVFLTILLINLIIDFSFASLLIVFSSVGCFYFALFNKSRDVYYENGKIYLRSLLFKEEYDISAFKGIYGGAFFIYLIRFEDGKEYNFRLLFEDVKLFFNSDPEFYAKRLNDQLLDRLRFYKSKDVL